MSDAEDTVVDRDIDLTDTGEVAVTLKETIEAIRRPPGPVRVGDRRADHWLVRVHFAVMLLLVVFVFAAFVLQVYAYHACTGR